MINMNHKNYYIYELILSLHSNDVYSKSIVSVIETDCNQNEYFNIV